LSLRVIYGHCTIVNYVQGQEPNKISMPRDPVERMGFTYTCPILFYFTETVAKREKELLQYLELSDVLPY
jgi:hypothetical protein